MKFILVLALLLTSTYQALTQPPPDFTLYDQDSTAWNLYDELGKGNTVLLDFFYANCVPCQTFTPEIEQLYQDYGSGTGSLIVLGISDRDNNAKLAVFDSTYGVSYPSGGTQGNGNDITNLYMTWFPFFSWPNYAVICRDTSIYWAVEPAIGMPALRNKIDTCTIVTNIEGRERLSSNVHLYPNPSHGILNLELLNVKVEPTTLTLYNLQGEFLRRTSVSEGTDGKVRWDVGELKAGFYLVEVTQGDHLLTREKFLLIH